MLEWKVFTEDTQTLSQTLWSLVIGKLPVSIPLYCCPYSTDAVTRKLCSIEKFYIRTKNSDCDLQQSSWESIEIGLKWTWNPFLNMLDSMVPVGPSSWAYPVILCPCSALQLAAEASYSEIGCLYFNLLGHRSDCREQFQHLLPHTGLEFIQNLSDFFFLNS